MYKWFAWLVAGDRRASQRTSRAAVNQEPLSEAAGAVPGAPHEFADENEDSANLSKRKGRASAAAAKQLQCALHQSGFIRGFNPDILERWKPDV